MLLWIHYIECSAVMYAWPRNIYVRCVCASCEALVCTPDLRLFNKIIKIWFERVFSWQPPPPPPPPPPPLLLLCHHYRCCCCYCCYCCCCCRQYWMLLPLLLLLLHTYDVCSSKSTFDVIFLVLLCVCFEFHFGAAAATAAVMCVQYIRILCVVLLLILLYGTQQFARAHCVCVLFHFVAAFHCRHRFLCSRNHCINICVQKFISRISIYAETNGYKFWCY